MKIERKKYNCKRFTSLSVGSVFEYDCDLYMKIESVDTDFNDEYQVYDKTYNAVNLKTGHLEWFNFDCVIEEYPEATIMI